MLFAPLGHPQHISQSCAHLLHLLTPLPCVLLGFHALASLLIFPSSLPPPCFVQKNETHPQSTSFLMTLSRYAILKQPDRGCSFCRGERYASGFEMNDDLTQHVWG